MRKLTMALLALALPAAAAAQSQNANATVTIPEVLAITVDQTNIAFPNVTVTDFANQYVDAGVTSTIDTRGNVVHDITIQANAASFNYAGTATPAPVKPASDLLWSNDGGSSFNAIDDVTAADVATALSQGVNAGAASVTYRIALDLATDAPGDYSLGFVYTVVAN